MNLLGLDETDNEILRILADDGRASYSAVAKAVGLTRTAVKNRIDTLEKNGVIGGYRAVICPQNTSANFAFIFCIETSADQFETVTAVEKRVS